MHDLKDKIIADLRSELDTARAVIKLMEENERLAEERHGHELREAKRAVRQSVDALLSELAEALGHYEDVDDGEDGPRPNHAMSARTSIDIWRGHV